MWHVGGNLSRPVVNLAQMELLCVAWRTYAFFSRMPYTIYRRAFLIVKLQMRLRRLAVVSTASRKQKYA